jgi:hypothetical protein
MRAASTRLPNWLELECVRKLLLILVDRKGQLIVKDMAFEVSAKVPPLP